MEPLFEFGSGSGVVVDAWLLELDVSLGGWAEGFSPRSGLSFAAVALPDSFSLIGFLIEITLTQLFFASLFSDI